jgi:hypothetical protein
MILSIQALFQPNGKTQKLGGGYTTFTPTIPIYLVDVGLLRRLAQLAPTAFREGNRLFTEFKGALTENYVLNIPPVYGQSGEPADGACTEPAKQEYKQL